MPQPTLTIHRGGVELGGVALELQTAETRLLLDCGIGGDGGEQWVDEIQGLDGVWISHAHLDHCGALPKLLAGRPLLGGWCSGGTRRLMEATLPAVEGIDEQQAVDVAGALEVAPLRRYTDVGRGEVRLMPFAAGHVLGARTVVVESGGEDPSRLMYTGDFCCHDQPVLPGARLPATDVDFEIDTLVMEGVLATDREADEIDVAAEWQRLAEFAGGDEPALVAVSPVGESVEVAGALREGGAELVVDASLEPVFEVYGRTTAGGEVLEAVEFAELDDFSKAFETGATVVAPGDQLQPNTPARQAATELLDRSAVRIAILNRAYSSTLAGRLLDADPGDEFGVRPGDRQTLRARVERFTLPNHAPRWQLVGTVEALEPERVVLVHGRESQLQTLRRAILDRGFEGEVMVPENGETLHPGQSGD